MATVRIGDIGIVFDFNMQRDNAALDVSSASAANTKLVLIRKPDGTLLSKAVAFVGGGTTGGLRYTSVSGDLDQVGTYYIQIKVIITAGTFWSEQSQFEVEDLV